MSVRSNTSSQSSADTCDFDFDTDSTCDMGNSTCLPAGRHRLPCLGTKSADDPLKDLEDKLGYKFKDRAWLHEALTHRSWNAANPSPGTPTYSSTPNQERLEFLGDALLGDVVAVWLFDHSDPVLSEAEMTLRRSVLVDASYCESVSIGLDVELLIRTGGTTTPTSSTLADTAESLIGAVFKDSGCFKTTRNLIHRLFLSKDAMYFATEQNKKNYIKHYGELYQKRFKTSVPNPKFALARGATDGQGAVFSATLDVSQFESGIFDGDSVEGRGCSHKEAKNDAMRIALDILEKKDALDVPRNGNDARAKDSAKPVIPLFQGEDPIKVYNELLQRVFHDRKSPEVKYTQPAGHPLGTYVAQVNIERFECGITTPVSGQAFGKTRARRQAMFNALTLLEEKGYPISRDSDSKEGGTMSESDSGPGQIDQENHSRLANLFDESDSNLGSDSGSD